MMPKTARLFTMLAAALLSGCAGINQTNRLGNPFAPSSPLASSVVAKWEKELAGADVTEIGTRRERNDLVYRLIFVSDYRFSRYEADLMLGKATRDSFIDMSMFGLNTAATLITPGAQTKMLSAIAGGLGFSRATVEKNFYLNHTAPVLMAKMRALRTEKLNEIVKNLSRSIEDYPASLAIIDVLEYYNRGTMLGALRAISNDTAVQAIRAEGGKVSEAEKAPPVSFQIDGGMIAAQSRGSAPVRSYAPTVSNDLFRRRRALGSFVNDLKRQRDSAKAVTILQAGNIPVMESEAIGVLAEVVNDIGSKTELATWEKAFGVSANRPERIKVAPPVIAEPIEGIDGKPTSKTPIPKTAPPVVTDKSKTEPL